MMPLYTEPELAACSRCGSPHVTEQGDTLGRLAFGSPITITLWRCEVCSGYTQTVQIQEVA